jgi:tetratricopeptide (TPR) repeat protein
MSRTSRPPLPADRAVWTFAQLLDWHLARGTRPKGTPTDVVGDRWTNKLFAPHVGSNERTVRNWRYGRTAPQQLELIEKALFGDNQAYALWREELRVAYRAIAQDPGEIAECTTEDHHRESAAAVDQILRPDRCLGRERETALVIDTLLANRQSTAILIHGAPGIGKTTITLEAASHPDIIARYGQRRWFVSLEAASNIHNFDVAVLQALGLDPAIAKFETALTRLAERPALVILDNLETSWEADRLAVEDRLARLARVPGIALLASFRGVDAVLGAEWTIETEVSPLQDAAAKALFFCVARKISEDDPHLESLLYELGGVPLAISLVAMRVRPFSTLSDIWAEWKETGVALARRMGVEPSRLTSVPHSIEFSLRSLRLRDAGRRLFRILGALPAGLSSTDRRELFSKDAFEAASELLATGLAFERAGRLMMLPPIRDYAWRCYPPEGGEADSWCGHYLELAADQGNQLWTSKGGEAIDRLVPEWPNIEAALWAAPERNKADRAANAMLGVSRLLATTGVGTPESIQALAEKCLAMEEAQCAAQCMWSLGDIALYRSDNDTAECEYARALPLFERTSNAPGSIHGVARCIRGQAEIALRTTNLTLAVAKLEDSLLRFRRVGDLFGEGYCLEGLAEIALRRDDLDSAEKQFTKAKLIYQKGDIALGEANATKGLADVAANRKNYTLADRLFDEAGRLYKKTRIDVGVANCALRQADLALERFDHGDPTVSREVLLAAERTYGETLSMYCQVADKLGQGNSVYGMGEVARRLGNYELARARFNDALPMYQDIGESISIGWAYFRLAQISAGSEKDTFIKAARETWHAAGMTNLFAQLESITSDRSSDDVVCDPGVAGMASIDPR